MWRWMCSSSQCFYFNLYFLRCKPTTKIIFFQFLRPGLLIPNKLSVSLSSFFLSCFPFKILPSFLLLFSFFCTHCKLRLFILLIVKNLLCYPRSWGWKGQNHWLKTRWEWNGKAYIKNLVPSRNYYRMFWNRNKSKWYQTFCLFISLWVCETGSRVTQVPLELAT